jgi:hypothetical protein
MTTYILSQEPVKWEDLCRHMGKTVEQLRNELPRRVILDEIPHSEDVLGTITARNWIEARAKVSESKFYHIDGQGWFLINTDSAAFTQSVTDAAQGE